MQNLPIYLYPNTLNVILDLDSTTKGVNRVMYQHDLTIQKGIKNKVRIQFKNSDQKRITISNTSTYVFSMFDAATQQLVLEKQLDIIDDGVTFATRGLGELTLSENDTLDLTATDYRFSVKYLNPADNTYLPTYSNTYYGVAGQVKVNQDVYPVLQPSQEIIEFQRVYNDSISLYQHFSGNIYAYPELNGNTALHTVAMYMTGFKGTVHIEGTLYNSPAEFGRYARIDTRVYDGFTGVDYINFNGVFSYIRVIYQPAKNPAEYNNDNPAYYGSFDKFLYRC
jgi:hypothetical protein